jgi:hypothetical protein
MPLLSIQAGATSQSINIFLRGRAAPYDGVAGLAAADLAAAYSFSGTFAAPAALPLVDLPSLAASHSPGGLIALGAASMPGWYRLDLPDDALAAGRGRQVSLRVSGASVRDYAETIELESSPLAAAVAAAILADPAHKLATDAEGRVQLQPDQPGVSLITIDSPVQKLEVNWAVSGNGTVVVDHDYGGDDALAVQTQTGEGVRQATIWAFTKADFDAGHRDASRVKGQTLTDDSGRWATPMLLEPGFYVLMIFKQGEIPVTDVALTVQ